jgi:beta-lactamase class D
LNDEFLSRLVGELSVSAEAIQRGERNHYRRQPATNCTERPGGSSRQKLGWWVGWIELGGKVYPFALNIDLKNDADAERRVPLGRECLQALGKL